MHYIVNLRERNEEEFNRVVNEIKEANEVLNFYNDRVMLGCYLEPIGEIVESFNKFDGSLSRVKKTMYAKAERLVDIVNNYIIYHNSKKAIIFFPNGKVIKGVSVDTAKDMVKYTNGECTYMEVE